MPPRYAYWTILVDGQPTAFRAGMQEDLMPTFNRLKEKHPSAEMKWFQNGKLWNSRLDAQEAMHERGERGRMGDKRQGGFRERNKFAPEGREARRSSRPASGGGREGERENGKLAWKPKGEFTPAPKRTDRPEWKPKGEWKQKRFATEGSESRRSAQREGGTKSKLDWTPKSGYTGAKPAGASGEKRKWVPKAEYKKSQGIEARRDKNWRPGGEHKDPRQKYKDAKKAKWSKFKSNIRQRWEAKGGKPVRRNPKGEGGPPKKRRDEE